MFHKVWIRDKFNDIINARESVLVPQGKWQKCQTVVKYTPALEARSLLPKSSACIRHSYIVWWYTIKWPVEGLTDSKSIYLGWKIEGNVYTDIMARKELLDINKCNSKLGCNIGRCQCKEYGLEYTTVCGKCKVTTCEKRQQVNLSVNNLKTANDILYIFIVQLFICIFTLHCYCEQYAFMDKLDIMFLLLRMS